MIALLLCRFGLHSRYEAARWTETIETIRVVMRREICTRPGCRWSVTLMKGWMP